MIFEEIWFNDEFLKGKSQAEFKKEVAMHNLSEAKLKELYAIINGKPQKEEVAEEK
jgi:hypothetical protein